MDFAIDIDREEEFYDFFRNELNKLPCLDTSLPINELKNYKRVKLPLKLLEKILFHFDGFQFLEINDLRKLDLSELNFNGQKLVADRNLSCSTSYFLDLSYTNINLDPQKLVNKKLCGINLRGVDLCGKDFTGVKIQNADLSYTGAKINSQKVWKKSIFNTNLKGIDLSNADFNDVDVKKAKLNDTNAKLDASQKKLIF